MTIRCRSLSASTLLAESARLLFLSSLTVFIFNFAAPAQETGRTVISENTSAKNTKPKTGSVSDGSISSPVTPSAKDIEETVKTYQSDDPARNVKLFQSRMPPPITNAKIREDILLKLPATVLKLKIENSELTEKFRKLTAPVLELYRRERVYDILIFQHETPVMFSDSGVVLVVSTGMITRAQSDDELLGYVAHEVAHEYFARYSIYSKYLLKLISEGDSEAALKNKLAETLALIELQCDAFAALTLAYLNYQTIAFIEGMERIERDFPSHSVGFHPPDSTRRKVVESILSIKHLQIKAKPSGKLEEVKQLIQALDNMKIK